MISLTPHGRRAEEFAALLEGRGSSGDSRDAELLEVVGALRTVPEVAPRTEYVAQLRERLMVEAELVLSDVERKLALPAPQRHRRDRRIAIAAGSLALVGVTSSVAVASQGALPGDTLYPIKRALEGASTSLTFDESTKGARMLDNASGRLAEVEALNRRSDADEKQLRETLAAFTSQSEQAADLLLDDYADGGDSQGVEKLREFAASSITVLAALSDRLPAGSLEALGDAVTTLTRIDDLANALCPGCSGGIDELPANLATRLAAAQVEDRGAARPQPVPTLVPTTPTYSDETDTEPEETVPTDLPTTVPPTELPQQPTPTPTTPPTSDPTKGLTDVLTGDDGLLGEDGLLGGILGGLLGSGGLLGGSDNK